MGKRILFARATIYPTEHPGNIRIKSFVNYFAKQGYDVTLAMLSKENKNKTQDNIKRAEEEGFVFSPFRIPKLIFSFINIVDRVLWRLCLCPYNGYFQTLILEQYVLRKFTGDMFDLIIVSVPQTGSLRVANKVSRRWGVPWVVDFRDLPDEIDVNHKKIITRREFLYTTEICKSASFAVTVSGPLRQALLERYGFKDVGIVYNGFEGDCDFNASGDCVQPSTFDIVYTGIIAYGRDPGLLFKGLDVLKKQNFDLSDVRVVLAGVSHQSITMYDKFESFDRVVLLGRKSRAECIKIQRTAGALLCLASLGCVGILTSKIFDYACAGRPVLSIPKDNDVLDDFIEKSGIGVSCSDPDALAEWLKRQIEAWRMQQPPVDYTPNREFITSFSRENQAIRFADMLRERFFDRIISKNQTGTEV